MKKYWIFALLFIVLSACEKEEMIPTLSSGTPNGVETSRFKTTVSLGTGIGSVTVSLDKDVYQPGDSAIYAGVLHLECNSRDIALLRLNLTAARLIYDLKQDIYISSPARLSQAYYFQKSFKVENEPGFYIASLDMEVEHFFPNSLKPESMIAVGIPSVYKVKY